jgi:hypothetical protein
VTTTAAPPALTTADVLDKAATVITLNGHHQAFLYDVSQAKGGTSISRCRVDVFGAINIAIHGSPRYSGTGLGQAAEEALRAHTGHLDVTAWNDTAGRTGDDAIRLLRETAAALRSGANS